MRIAFLFPGQGSQTIGMGKDIYENYEEARQIYEKVKEITGIDIAKISFEGPEEILNQTKYTQLAILTMSLAIVEVLNNHKINAELSTGLSLGEYSALIYSNALDFEEGIKLVQKRGEFMQNLVPDGEWLMSAIIGMDEKQVQEVCSKVQEGFVVPANFNSSSQIVISGERKAVEDGAKIAKEMGAKKAIVLKTAGPFHTEKLIDSSEALRKELDSVEFRGFKTKVIKNIDGDFYKESDNIKDILAKHIISPVRFDKSINTMINEGIDTFIEIGPGKTLSGFVRKTPTEKEITVLNINNVESLENVIENVR